MVGRYLKVGGGKEEVRRSELAQQGGVHLQEGKQHNDLHAIA